VPDRRDGDGADCPRHCCVISSTRPTILPWGSLAPERASEILVADDLVVTADPRLTRVVLDNLIGNAWKYTSRPPRGRIEVGVTLHADARAIFVRDNGCGFDMTYNERLFLPFQRLHDPGEYGGDGIGRATVQRIVQRHGGKVWSDSTVGYRSTFYFSLPELAGDP